MTVTDAATALGISEIAAYSRARRCGVKLARVNHVRDDYAACAAQGMTKAETARHLGVSWRAVQGASLRHGIAFRGDKVKTHLMTPQERADYRIYRATQHTQVEALHAIGRADLVQA